MQKFKISITTAIIAVMIPLFALTAKPRERTYSEWLPKFVVVDGQPSDLKFRRSKNVGTYLKTLGLTWQDVAPVEVNRDGESAWKVWGDRASEGVVVIETLEYAASQSVSEEVPIDKLGDLPKFNGGGVETFTLWVASRVRYPEKAAENGIQGRVIALFEVKKDGTIGEITIKRSPDPQLSAEVIRVIKESPLWTPGSVNGQPVNSNISIPVEFKLQ